MSLDELPDAVCAPLGSRGVQPLSLKECPRCGNSNVQELHLMSKRKGSKENKDSSSQSWNVTVDEYDIKCGKCNYSFTVRCQNIYGGLQGKERIVTFVHIITEDGNNEGWLGNY